jgi:Family of unknown function (DUF5723)
MKLFPLKYILPIALFCCVFTAKAQQDITLYQYNNLWSATHLNPAFFPKDRSTCIGLPSFGLGAGHSGGISYNDLIRRSGNQNLLDIGQAIGRLDDENTIFAGYRLETLGLGRRIGARWAFQVTHTIRADANLRYPKQLAEVLWYGNAPYIGKTLEIGPALRANSWQEMGFGAIFAPDQALTIGLRFKYLSGIGALNSLENKNNISIFTDPDIYQLQVKADYGFQSAGIISRIDTSGLGFDIMSTSLSNRLFSGNNGIGADLGIHWRESDRISFSFSILDLGSTIRWRDEAYTFRSQGDYRYEGQQIPASTLLKGGNQLRLNSQLDTLNDVFQFKRSEGNFTTTLPLRIYAGGTFRPVRHWIFGVTVMHQRQPQFSTTSAGVSAQWQPARWFNAGLQYSINDRTGSSVGGQLVLTPGPIQLYLMADNVITAFQPFSSPYVAIRAGMSVVLGHIGSSGPHTQF